MNTEASVYMNGVQAQERVSRQLCAISKSPSATHDWFAWSRLCRRVTHTMPVTYRGLSVASSLQLHYSAAQASTLRPPRLVRISQVRTLQEIEVAIECFAKEATKEQPFSDSKVAAKLKQDQAIAHRWVRGRDAEGQGGREGEMAV